MKSKVLDLNEKLQEKHRKFIYKALGKFSSMAELARAMGKSERYLTRHLALKPSLKKQMEVKDLIEKAVANKKSKG